MNQTNKQTTKNNQRTAYAGMGVGKRSPSSWLVEEVLTGADTMGVSVEVPQKLKTDLP